MNGIGRGEEKKDNNSILTKETVGMTMLLFSVIALVITITGPVIFGDIGVAITGFFVGLAGFYVYPLFLLVICVSLMMIAGKKFIPTRILVRTMLLLLAAFAIVHTATAERFFGEDYGAYLGGCWTAASESVAGGTGCGVIFGLIAYPIRLVLSAVGSYVLFSALALAAFVWFLFLTPLGNVFRGKKPERSRKKEKSVTDASAAREEYPAGMAFDDLPSPERTYMSSSSYETAPRYSGYPEYAPAASAPVYTPPAAEPVTTDPHRRSREILFGGTPAERYQHNLANDPNSAYNTRLRGSSAHDSYTDTTSAPSAPVQPSVRPAEEQDRYSSDHTAQAPSQPTPGYAGSYTADTERTRPQMPKRVSPVEREYPSRDSSLNYPAPSYRAPSVSPSTEQDFYSHDVPTEYTSTPHIDDIPEAPVAPRRSLREEPTLPSSRESEPEQPRRSEPPVQPAQPTPPAEGRRIGFGEERTRTDYSEYDRGADRTGSESRGRTSERGLFDPAPQSAADLFDDDHVFFEEDTEDLTPPPSSRGMRGLGGSRDVPLQPAADASDSERTPEPPASTFSTADSRRSVAPAEPAPARVPEPKPEPEKPKAKKKHVWKKYRRPDIELFDTYEDKPQLSNEEIGRNSGIIIDTLRSYRLETQVTGVKVGASVTRYDLEMPTNATINMVTKYAGEIALNLMVKGVNMYANPQVRGISIEVPNKHRSTVGLKSILLSDEFRKNDPEALMFALGQDLEGNCVSGNITEMTHLLIAGTTGSGKSITIHGMLISMLYKYSPEELRLILVDPKQTEFTIYEGIPHLMINEIITQAPKVVAALNWAVKEMERRYTLFNEKTRAGMAVRKIDEYNSVLTEDEEKLPKIVIVVDEFADLMLIAKKDLEDKIQRLTQKARAAGIHIVLATQRPSADVVTGIIKSNLPTRIALSVDSDLNSRIILDEVGAESLLGYGDMIVKAGGKSTRVQGAYISTPETQRVISYIKENNECYFDNDVSDFIDKGGSSSEGGGGGPATFADNGSGGVNEAYIRALAIVVKLGQASISLIQRKCSVGYNHAGKIIEWMESMQYISPFDGKAKARTVLLTVEEFEAKYGPIDDV